MEIILSKSDCTNDNKILVKYGIVNTKNFIRYNTRVGLKIFEGDKIVACKQFKMEVPIGSDGSPDFETIIDYHCGEQNFNVIGMVSHNSTKQYKVDEWFEGCP